MSNFDIHPHGYLSVFFDVDQDAVVAFYRIGFLIVRLGGLGFYMGCR